MEISTYTDKHSKSLRALLKREGPEWGEYWQEEGWARYMHALDTSHTFIALSEGELVGFARCRDDYGFGVYVQDLLVDKSHRGNGYGGLLLQHVRRNFNSTVYVLSDVDPYYEGLGYKPIGTVFVVS